MPAPVPRVSRLASLFKMVRPIPQEWITDLPAAGINGKPKATIQECNNYKQLINTWRKALRWTDGLDMALSVMLASITSTKSVGDQLWVKIIGPAACGKSTLCEAVSTNTQYVLAKSTIRGFHSGYGEQDEDNSLLAKLYNMTLVTKDGDTLLQTPNLGQILSEARDIYDSVSRTHYRNKNSNDYAGVRLTWILCGTSSLRSIDSSELGERFLDCVIMEDIDDELEDAILWRVANRSSRNLAIESDNTDASKHYDPELIAAMQQTGGYVGYLRENATALLSAVSMSDDALRQCMHYGKFVAYMRARPSKMQEENAERELASRLVSQIVRLAKCLAVVLNQNAVNAEVLARVQKVAMDTSRGVTLNIAKALYERDGGLEHKALSLYTTLPDTKLRELLHFMRQIGMVKLVEVKERGMRRRRWQLTPRISKLYEEVVQ